MDFTPFWIIDKCGMTDISKYKLENLSVAIVDDHDIVLEGFRSFMVKSGVGRVLAFNRAGSLLDAVSQHHFDAYIVDVELPDMDVSLLIDNIRNLHPEARIIINTVHEEMWVVSKVMEKNVDGVLYKTAHLEQLLEAVVAVCQGHQYFCTNYKRNQRQIQVQNDIPTSREIDVLKEIAQGRSTKEIAMRLFISENTVENHRKNLFRKLKAVNMASLIVKAIAAGYINPEEMA